MYCSNCGKQVADTSRFCTYCGYKLVPIPQPAHNGSSITDKINNMAGGEGKVDIHLRDLFSDVFKHHSAQEAEEIFICGTSKTTPTLSTLSDNWPKPWLFSRVGVVLLITYLLIVGCWQLFDNVLSIVNIMLLGSFVMPVVVMIFFFETNITRNISVATVLKIFAIGGGASLFITLFLDSAVGNDGNLDFMGAILTGLVEETAKMIIVAYFINKIKNCKYILNGILIGASVGAGFAAFESAGYAFYTFIESFTYSFYYTEDLTSALYYGYTVMSNTINVRAMLSPGGHVVWAAITGAAIMIALNHKKFNLNFLTNGRFLFFFGISIALHAIWDVSDIPLLNSLDYFRYIALVIIAWFILLILMQNGLKEIGKMTHHEIQQYYQ